MSWRVFHRSLLPLVILCLLAGCRSQPRQVLLTADGQRRFVPAEGATVGEVLRDAGVALGPLDWVEPPSYTAVQADQAIVVHRVRERLVRQEQPVPYEHQTRRDATLPQGESRVHQLGQNGVARLTFVIRYEDDIEVSRHLSATEVLTPAQPEILIVGTRAGAGVAIRDTLVYLAGGNAWLIRQQSHLKDALSRSGDLDGHVFSLSPDGRRLLFTRRPLGGEAGASGPLNTLWLVRTDLANDEPRYLGLDGVLWAEWQPGVAELSFAFSTAERVPPSPGWKAHNNLELATVDRAGRLSAQRQLLPPEAHSLYSWWGRSWAWAPDGAMLAWADAARVGTVDLNGDLQQHLTFAPYETGGDWVWTPRPAWHPNGESFAAVIPSRAAAGEPVSVPRFNLSLIPRAGGEAQPLDQNVGMWALPTWDARGRLAYGRAEDPAGSATSRYDILLTNASAHVSRRLFPDGDLPGVDVPWMAWSPDTRGLVVVWQGDLYLLDPDGRQPPQALTAEGGASQPQWR